MSRSNPSALIQSPARGSCKERLLGASAPCVALCPSNSRAPPSSSSTWTRGRSSFPFPGSSGSRSEAELPQNLRLSLPLLSLCVHPFLAWQPGRSGPPAACARHSSNSSRSAATRASPPAPWCPTTTLPCSSPMLVRPVPSELPGLLLMGTPPSASFEGLWPAGRRLLGIPTLVQSAVVQYDRVLSRALSAGPQW